jgi:hypothetical protein
MRRKTAKVTRDPLRSLERFWGVRRNQGGNEWADRRKRRVGCILLTHSLSITITWRTNARRGETNRKSRLSRCFRRSASGDRSSSRRPQLRFSSPLFLIHSTPLLSSPSPTLFNTLQHSLSLEPRPSLSCFLAAPTEPTHSSPASADFRLPTEKQCCSSKSRHSSTADPFRIHVFLVLPFVLEQRSLKTIVIQRWRPYQSDCCFVFIVYRVPLIIIECL